MGIRNISIKKGVFAPVPFAERSAEVVMLNEGDSRLIRLYLLADDYLLSGH
jgi:hypothetical protein